MLNSQWMRSRIAAERLWEIRRLGKHDGQPQYRGPRSRYRSGTRTI